VSLATRGTSVLLSHNRKVRNIFQRILKERNVELFFGANITGMETYDDKSTVSSKSNDKLPLYRILMAESSSSILNRDDNDILFHECLWCTSAGAPTWLKSHTPLQTTDDGFVKINDTYECFDHPGIFAAGDCCHNVRHPRPKGMVNIQNQRKSIFFCFMLVSPFSLNFTECARALVSWSIRCSCRTNFIEEPF